MEEMLSCHLREEQYFFFWQVHNYAVTVAPTWVGQARSDPTLHQSDGPIRFS